MLLQLSFPSLVKQLVLLHGFLIKFPKIKICRRNHRRVKASDEELEPREHHERVATSSRPGLEGSVAAAALSEQEDGSSGAGLAADPTTHRWKLSFAGYPRMLWTSHQHSPVPPAFTPATNNFSKKPNHITLSPRSARPLKQLFL